MHPTECALCNLKLLMMHVFVFVVCEKRKPVVNQKKINHALLFRSSYVIAQC